MSKSPGLAKNRSKAPIVRRPRPGVRQPGSERFLWDRLPEETDYSYYAFTKYRDMRIIERSVAAVQRLLQKEKGYISHSPKPMKHVHQWAKRFLWKDRAAAYDRYKSAAAHAEVVVDLANEYKSQHMVGTFLQSSVMRVLEEKSDTWWHNMRPDELTRMLKLGLDISENAKDRMIDLSVAILDSEIETNVFEPGSIQEQIADAIQRGDWQSAQRMIEKAAAAERLRISSMPTNATPLSAQSKEKVRSFTQLLTQKVAARYETSEVGSEGDEDLMYEDSGDEDGLGDEGAVEPLDWTFEIIPE